MIKKKFVLNSEENRVIKVIGLAKMHGLLLNNCVTYKSSHVAGYVHRHNFHNKSKYEVL